MFGILRRIGFFRRRWVWALLLLATLGLVGYWMVPWRGADAQLELVALRPDGSFAQWIMGVPVANAEPVPVRRAEGDTTIAPAAPTRRRGVPLILAISNSGRQAGRPERLILNLPRWYRLIDPGPRVRRELIGDEALQRYVIEADFPAIEGGRVPTLLPSVDTLWLEPWVPDYYCTSDGDSIPQLIASAPPDTAGIVPVRIFYSFEGPNLRRRNTGLLTVELPGEMFRRRGPADASSFPVELHQPRAERPFMGVLFEGGSRRAECGPPGDPMILFSSLWITANGGKLISVHFGGEPKKEYYDLNNDSIIELEMWDPDGDGELEATRRMNVPIPEYMLPEPPPPPEPVVAVATDSLAGDSTRLDSTRVDSMGTPLPGAFAGVARAPSSGVVTDIATLGRQLIPGDLSTARRLFVPRTAPRREPEPDGLLGTPLPGAQIPDPQAEPPVVNEPEAPSPPEEAEPEPEGDPDDMIPVGEPVED